MRNKSSLREVQPQYAGQRTSLFSKQQVLSKVKNPPLQPSLLLSSS